MENIKPTQYHEYNEELQGFIFNRDRCINEYVRPIRNNLLNYCDWTQLVDAQITEEKKLEWQAYRQNLRDFPETIPNDVHDLSEIVWPEKP